MPVVSRKRRLYAFLLASRPWALGLLAAGALAAFFMFLATRGPRPAKSGATGAQASSSSSSPTEKRAPEDVARDRALDERLTGLEAVETPDPADRAWLQTALSEQRERLRGVEGAGRDEGTRRVSRLANALANAEAVEKAARIAALDAEAQSAGPDRAAAEAKLREAFALQQTVNRSDATERWKDHYRQSRLQFEADSLAASRAADDVEMSLATARAAVSAERWAEALAAYKQAREAQGRINREFARTRFVDVAREQQISQEIASLASAEPATRVEAIARAGEEEAAAGRHDAAAQRFTEAKSAQETLNAKFAGSRFVSTARVDALEVRRQTELSAAAMSQAATLDRAATEALRRGDVKEARARIDELATRMEETFTHFPRSTRLDAELRRKAVFLRERGDVIATVQGEVAALLAALPSSSAAAIGRADGSSNKTARMLAGEVSQGLYERVTGANPSRRIGAALPADSVSWTEAREFCRGLSRLLGRTARLPTEAEFRAALTAGNADRSGAPRKQTDATHDTPADAAAVGGFADTLGNVAEWLDAPEDSADAPVAGGSYLTTPDALEKIPLERMPKTSRARHIGFRVVVE